MEVIFIIRAFKIRLHPTKKQEQLLFQSAGTSRFIYNWTLARQIENYNSGGKFISNNNLRKEITILKKTDLSWLNQVSNNVAKQAVKDACEAYVKFFKGKNGFPNFKSKKNSKKSFYNDNTKLKVKTEQVLLEKVGYIKTSEQIPIGVNYTNPRISFDNKYWYISVGVDQPPIVQKLNKELTIGIDVGIKDLAICSNGMTFKNINKSKKVKKINKRLKGLQKQVSRKYDKNKIKKGGENCYQFKKTKNITKLEKQIKLVYRKLAMIRNNHLHQATNKIVKAKPSKVVMETLNIKGMMKNKHLSKAIATQRLSEFKRQMQYKCEFNGIEFVEADKWFPSSKTCSECGHIKKALKLSERVYICEECGCVIDRDLNASINLSRYSA